MLRRKFIAAVGALGVGSALPRVVEASVDRGMTDEEMAEKLANSTEFIKVIGYFVKQKFSFCARKRTGSYHPQKGDLMMPSSVIASVADWQRVQYHKDWYYKNERRCDGTVVISEHFSREGDVVNEIIESSLDVSNLTTIWLGKEVFAFANGSWIKLESRNRGSKKKTKLTTFQFQRHW